MKNTLVVVGVIVVAVLIYLGVKSAYGPSSNTSSYNFTDNGGDYGLNSAIPTSSSGLPMGSPTDLIPPSPTASPSIEPESGLMVSIDSLKFVPASLVIQQGSTVVFSNNDTVAHTVTSSSFDSGNIQPGNSFSYTFTQKGTFSYKCSIHSTMTGTIIVE